VSVKRLDDGLLAGDCDFCGSIRIMNAVDGSPERYFCDDCWAQGRITSEEPDLRFWLALAELHLQRARFALDDEHEANLRDNLARLRELVTDAHELVKSW